MAQVEKLLDELIREFAQGAFEGELGMAICGETTEGSSRNGMDPGMLVVAPDFLMDDFMEHS